MKPLPLLLLLVASCAPAPDEFLIGHLNPGRDSSEERALKLSAEKLNATEETNRPFSKRVVVNHADRGKSFEELHAQAVRVASLNRALVLVGGMHTDEAVNIGDAAQADSILAFSGAGYPGTKPNPFLFCLGISPARQAKSLVSFAAEKERKHFLLVTGKGFPDAFAQAIRSEVKANNALTLDEVTPTDDPTSKADLETRVSRSDAVFLCLNAAERAKFLAGALGKLPIHGVVLFAGEEIENLTPAQKSCYALASYPSAIEEEKSPFVTEYFKKYQSKLDLRASMMRDAFEVAVQLFKRTDSLQPKKLRDEILKKDARFDTLTGPIQFFPDGTSSRSHWLVEWKDAGWTTVKKFD